MKYIIKLTNGETLENVSRGLSEQWLEAWGWRVFKKPDGNKIDIPKASIVYITEVKK